MDVVDVWLAYQGITRTDETQDDLYNYLTEEMIDNTHNSFMIRSVEGRRRRIVDSYDETVNDDNPLFGRIYGAPRSGISLHVTLNNKLRKKRDGTETRYLLQGDCKVLQKNTTHVCLDCADIDASKN